MTIERCVHLYLRRVAEYTCLNGELFKLLKQILWKNCGLKFRNRTVHLHFYTCQQEQNMFLSMFKTASSPAVRKFKLKLGL